MKYLKYIILILIFNNPVNAQDIQVNFDYSYMYGISMEKIQFNNIIVRFPDYTAPELFSLENLPYIEDIYNIPFTVCRYNSGRLYLLPQLAPEEPYCNIAGGLNLSNSYGISLEFDKIQINNIIITNEAVHDTTFEAVNDTTNEAVHDTTFKFNFDKLQFEQDDGIILLSASAPNNIRIILDWNIKLPELDAHLTGPIAPYSLEYFHLYFNDIYNNGGIATLNVGYEEFETRPEIVTILPPIIDFETQQRDTTLRPGLYRFTVQHFYGNGNLLDSNATVRLQIGDEPNEHLFVLPNYEGLELLGEMDIWIVFELVVLDDRTVTVNPIQRYELGVSPHEIR